MRSGLPQISNNCYNQSLDSNRKKKNKQTPPNVNYKGITLKEYFRICDGIRPNEALGQIKEESRASSNQQFVETPSFNHEPPHHNFRAKIKTEVCQNDSESAFKRTFGRLAELDSKSKNGHVHSLEKGQKGHYFPGKKKEERKKIYTKVHTNPSKQPNIRSTLNSFYQIEQNKKKMLKKIQMQKQRANDLRLSQAFFITKYGSRFRIDSKILQGD